MFAASALSLVADGATVKDVIVVGLNTSGAVTLEKITLNGATAVPGVALWSEIKSIVLGDVEAARTVTASGTAAAAKPLVQKTLIKAADYFNARALAGVGGFAFTMVTGLTKLEISNLDVMPAPVSVLNPADPAFYADLWAINDWINSNSSLIASTVSAGAYGGAPSNTVSPAFMAGGSEGTTTFADWQRGLNLLKRAGVNSVCVLTADPAVHAALKSHCAYMCGIGRFERDAAVGLMNGAMTDLASKNEIKAQIVDLNSRHIRAIAQSIERYNTEGDRQEFTPPFAAAMVLGMQAGAAVATPLTHKYVNALAFRQSNTWNPVDDAEEMIQAGLCFLEEKEGVGRRVVRNITTHLSSNNLAYIEGSVNQAVNYAVYNFRNNMEVAVGKKGFAGTINAAHSVAVNTLGLIVAAEVIITWRSLAISLAMDALEVGTEIAPVLPINFVKNTLHLVTARQTAA